MYAAIAGHKLTVVIIPHLYATHPCMAEADGGHSQTLTGETLDFETERHALFYTDEGARAGYKKYTSALLTRRSSITGVPMCDEPAIMAWGKRAPKKPVWV